MGSYPSADLLYGIDLSVTEVDDWPWYTDEMEREHGDVAEALDHLLRDIKGVRYAVYGDLCSSYMGLVLCTQAVHATAYEAKPVGVGQLTGTVDDDAELRAAWAILYPDHLMPEPTWLIVASYG